MNNWKNYKWGDLASLEYGKSIRDFRTSTGKTPVYGTNGPIGFTTEVLCPFPSIIIGRKGAYRGVHYSPTPFFVIDTAFYLKPKENNIDLKFCYYNLLLQDINGLDSGSAIPSTRREDFYGLEVKLPDLPTQSRIASILSSLDNKIELNRRMNQTLEQMAQALFNHYFVDNIDPDNLPERWRLGKLNEEFEITMGQSPEGSSYNQDGKGVPFFQGRTDFNFRFPSFRIYTTSPKRFAKQFDVLISVRAPVGDINIALTDCCIGRGIGSVRDKRGYMSYPFYKLKSLTEIFQPYNGEGTVFGSINKDELGRIPVIIPQQEKVQAFENTVRPMDLKIYEMQKETENLTKIRDTLLPKLMSGEIDVAVLMNEEALLKEEPIEDIKPA